mmetsp:Transcript_57400/g.166163  ORF Transcript_57400/g.166163 Transcript_57400/m.166163 type:complete len:227 (-) Transcript_57400:15-695(-)
MNFVSSCFVSLLEPSRFMASKSLRRLGSLADAWANALNIVRRTRSTRCCCLATRSSSLSGPCHKYCKNSATSKVPFLSMSASAKTSFSSWSLTVLGRTFRMSRAMCLHSFQSMVFDRSASQRWNSSSHEMPACTLAALSFRRTECKTSSRLPRASGLPLPFQAGGCCNRGRTSGAEFERRIVGHEAAAGQAPLWAAIGAWGRQGEGAAHLATGGRAPKGSPAADCA